jgi:hypothetical protein
MVTSENLNQLKQISSVLKNITRTVEIFRREKISHKESEIAEKELLEDLKNI